MAKTVRIYRRKYSDKTHWCIRYDLNGKDKKEVIGTSKREAQIAAQKKAIELYGDRASLTIKDIKIGLENLYEEYMKRKRNLVDGSRKRYRNNFNAFIDFMKTNFPIASNEIKKIKRQHIEEFLDYLVKEKNWAPSTINGALGFINSLFIYAQKEDYILKSPSRDIEKFALNDEKEAPYFTREELVKIWDNVNPYWLHFLQILYYTGMRKGELINLTWKNVNLKKSKEAITLISSDEFRTKTGKKRTIPLKSEAIAILNKQKGMAKKYVFVSQTGKKIHPEKPYHAIKKALEKADLEGDVHKLRHTMASHAVMKGVSIYEVKELLGHQDIKTTMIYAHLSPTTLRSAIDKLESFPV